MAFITGSANGLADLLAAIQAACVANGWTLSGQVLRKGNCYSRLTVVGSDIQLVGGTGVDGSNALTLPGPQIARIGATAVPAALVFPLTYYVHIFNNPDEVYVFVNFSVSRWQWLAFGCSPAPGLPGTGSWYAAQSSTGASGSGIVNVYTGPVTAGGYSGGGLVSGMLFAQSGSWTNNYCCNSYFHHGLDGGDWSKPDGASLNTIGSVDAWVTQVPLLGRQPNVFNGETALIPIQLLAKRASTKHSLVGQMAHARYLRNDNYADGDIITLGADRWKTYPFVQKSSAGRDGGVSTTSGTFGIALRYDGP